jgi:hypothetical protein
MLDNEKKREAKRDATEEAGAATQKTGASLTTRKMRPVFRWKLASCESLSFGAGSGLLRNHLTFRMFHDSRFCGTASALEDRPSIEN